jgi:hypothetical protein
MLKVEDTRPDLSGFDFYISAYRELSTCRPIGMGIGPIPFTSIAEYAKIFDIGGEEFFEFLYYIRAMDDEFLRLEKERNDAESKKSSSKTTKGKRK